MRSTGQGLHEYSPLFARVHPSMSIRRFKMDIYLLLHYLVSERDMSHSTWIREILNLSFSAAVAYFWLGLGFRGATWVLWKSDPKCNPAMVEVVLLSWEHKRSWIGCSLAWICLVWGFFGGVGRVKGVWLQFKMQESAKSRTRDSSVAISELKEK